MFCPNCGSKMIDGKPFCINCGERLDVGQSTSQPTKQPQPQTQHQPYQPQPQTQYNRSRGNGKKTPLGLILGVTGGIVLIVAGIIVGMLLYGNSGKKDNNDGNLQGNSAKSFAQTLDTSGSKGFDYDFDHDSKTGLDGYVITSIGSCKDSNIVIPQGMENEDGEVVPYLWDDGDGFTGTDNAKSITLPKGTLEIRSGFGNSPKLEFIYIPNTVRSICSNLLENCPAIKEIIYAGTIDEWNAISKDNGWNSGLDVNPNFVIFCADGKIMSDGSSADGLTALNPDAASGTIDNEENGDATGTLNTEENDVSPSEVANALSTTDYAQATDFEWFIDVVDGDGTGAGVVVTYPDKVDRLIGDQNVYLNGGWKAFMYGSDKMSSYNSECERYFNAVIDTNGNDFNITLNWKYVDFGDGSIEESGSDLCKGTWDAPSGTASAVGSFCNVKIDNFYISKDGSAMYAVGSFMWQSGELDSIALMRTL